MEKPESKAGNPKPRAIPCLSDTVYQGKDAPNPSITTSCRAKGSSINFSRIQVSALMPSLFPPSLSFYSATLFDGFSPHLNLSILHFPSNWQSLMIRSRTLIAFPYLSALNIPFCSSLTTVMMAFARSLILRLSPSATAEASKLAQSHSASKALVNNLVLTSKVQGHRTSTHVRRVQMC